MTIDELLKHIANKNIAQSVHKQFTKLSDELINKERLFK